MPKFRKKTEDVEAVQYTGLNREEVIAFGPGVEWSCGPGDEHPGFVHVRTIAGRVEAKPGDWIVRGMKVGLYTLNPLRFAATYDPVPERDFLSIGPGESRAFVNVHLADLPQVVELMQAAIESTDDTPRTARLRAALAAIVGPDEVLPPAEKLMGPDGQMYTLAGPWVAGVIEE